MTIGWPNDEQSGAAAKISDQLLDSSSSTDSNYRAACRARSRKEFIAALGKVIEECDESLGWLEMLVENGFGPAEPAKALVDEADQLVAIFVKSRKTAERNYEAELSRQRQARRRKSQLSRSDPQVIRNLESSVACVNRQSHAAIGSRIRQSAVAFGNRQSHSTVTQSQSALGDQKIGIRQSALANPRRR